MSVKHVLWYIPCHLSYIVSGILNLKISFIKEHRFLIIPLCCEGFLLPYLGCRREELQLHIISNSAAEWKEHWFPLSFGLNFVVFNLCERCRYKLFFLIQRDYSWFLKRCSWIRKFSPQRCQHFNEVLLVTMMLLWYHIWNKIVMLIKAVSKKTFQGFKQIFLLSNLGNIWVMQSLLQFWQYQHLQFLN